MKLNKLLFSIGFLLSVVAILIFLLVTKYSPTQKKVVKNTAAVMVDYRTRSDNEKISYREAQIRNFYDFPDQFPKTVIDGKTLYLVGYSWSIGGIYNRKNTAYQGLGGVIVFEEVTERKYNLIWESRESMDHAEGDYSHFHDINNDGIPEIVVTDVTGTASTTSIYVYAWRQDTFQLITPAERTIVPNGEVMETKVGGYFKDLDNDQIDEIIDGYRDEDKLLLRERIYKFHKESGLYTFWKETSKPIEPIQPEAY